MSKGQAFTDFQYIYLMVQDLDNGEIVMIAFPNGGDWVVDEYNPFFEELEKEFNSLEEYLKSQQKEKSKEIKKKQ